MSLNSGFSDLRDVKVSDDEKQMIDAFLASKSAKICPPSGLTGNEQSAETHRMIMQKRKEFREKKRAAKQ